MSKGQLKGPQMQTSKPPVDFNKVPSLAEINTKLREDENNTPPMDIVHVDGQPTNIMKMVPHVITLREYFIGCAMTAYLIRDGAGSSWIRNSLKCANDMIEGLKQ